MMNNIKLAISHMRNSIEELSKNVDNIEEKTIDYGVGARKNVRAFSSSNIEFYALIYSIECLPIGTVFYYDPNDGINGSPAAGCLKLCWTQEGGCYGGICGDTVIFHEKFRKDHTVFRRLYSKG